MSPWLLAANDLGIEVVAPFDLSDRGGQSLRCPAWVGGFGSARGTVVAELGDPNSAAIREAAREIEMHISFVSASYSTYDRQMFVDMFEDWGWHGDRSPPAWYTSKPWGA